MTSQTNTWDPLFAAPAIAHELPGKRVWLEHPGGVGHHNLQLALQRYRRRGWSIVAPPVDAADKHREKR